MSSQRHKRDDYDMNHHRSDRRRSRSKSTSRRYRNRNNSRSLSRSRSRSVDRRRHRHHRSSFSRSPSRGHNYSNRRERRNISRRHQDSRSRSRSKSRTKSRRRSRSHTPTRSVNMKHQPQPTNYQKSNRQESRNDKMQSPVCFTREESNASTTSSAAEKAYLENLPLPKQEAVGAYYNLDTDEPIDKERIHREMEEKLRQALAKEGKVYPPPKPEASHPVFANDGSFLEIFKKMQEAQHHQQPTVINTVTVMPQIAAVSATASTTTYISNNTASKNVAPPPPIVGRRRGGKILKTGVVAKQKAQTDGSSDPKDFWSLYLAEVNKYKNNACETDAGNRPLVK